MAYVERYAIRKSKFSIFISQFRYPTAHHASSLEHYRGYGPKTQRRREHNNTIPTSFQIPPSPPFSTLQLLALPSHCPGCGAFTQCVSHDQAGFYSLSRKSVKAFIASRINGKKDLREEDASRESPGQADLPRSQIPGLNDMSSSPNGILSESKFKDEVPSPVCNRCHDLVHHNMGIPIIHPTLQSIQKIISESPYKYNHVYHILDAADFPLSLIPQLHRHLSLTSQRSRNRRAKTSKFYHGRKTELSFIITRSDLLAPQKEQVDHMVPYLIQVLRDALGSSAKNCRLGNIRCVSSKRGWWTKHLKEDIWARGGGGWMVGKVNVGKSNLLECVFPKGRNHDADHRDLRETARNDMAGAIDRMPPRHNFPLEPHLQQKPYYPSDTRENSLLPPAPTETAFPVMPIVSSLPGTTASPIRLPFGGGKGELIDLPGLSRSKLETYVTDDHKSDLVMRQRLKPAQYVLKPTQSLLLGGLIRITPKASNVVILAYPFVPLEGHVTSTEKAINIHSHENRSGIPTITRPGVGNNMASAGVYYLKHDVTQRRSGPLTSAAAVGLKADVLPFKVLSIDILVEGCGWVELVAQVRKRDLESEKRLDENTLSDEVFPAVEVFSPEGKYIGVRRPMNAWLLGKKKSTKRGKRSSQAWRSTQRS